MPKKTTTFVPQAAIGRAGILALAPQAFLLDLIYDQPLTYAEPFTVEGEAAVVDIRGVLSHHPDHPGCDSYDAIRERFTAALTADCRCVILRVDSLGGDVSGCFDLAAHMRREATAAGKPLLAYTDGTAASAAYALACVADVIGVGMTGFVGSIGIINAYRDETAADAAQGVRYGFATSGMRKADGNPHVPITDASLEVLQRQVDDLADVFYAHVSTHRGLSVEAIRGLEAGLFFGAGAVALRLADRVCSWGEMVSLAAEPPGIPVLPTPKGVTMPKYLEEARKLAGKMVQDGDEHDQKLAKRMMALFGEPGDKKDDAEGKAEGAEPSEDKKDADAKAEDSKDEPKAESEPAKSDQEMKAAAVADTPDMAELYRELHALKAERQAEKVAAERASLLATRPDFDAKTRAWLANPATPIAQVRQAVASFPRIPVLPAAASQATGTRGAAEGQARSADDLDGPPSLEAYIRDRMGRSGAGRAGVVQAGRDQVFFPMTPAQARAAAEKKGAK